MADIPMHYGIGGRTIQGGCNSLIPAKITSWTVFEILTKCPLKTVFEIISENGLIILLYKSHQHIFAESIDFWVQSS